MKKTEIMDNFYDDNERLFTDGQGGRYLRFQTKIEDENPKIIKQFPKMLNYYIIIEIL